VPHLHRLAGLLLLCAVIAGVFAPPETDHGAAPGGSARKVVERRPAGDRAGPPPASAPAAARTAAANELGEVPVLMYHRILAKPQSSLDRKPEDLRAELTRLAREGYVPVTAAEFVTARMDIPAGRHPVVLTFDDGSNTHLALDAQGDPMPDTAVGVIMAVAAQNPGFRPVATFFVNHDPFTLGPRTTDAVRWLGRHGFEIANHTTHHLDLAGMSREQVQKEIGTDQRMITDLGGTPPVTFAFPFGTFAHLDWVDRGSAGGAKWDFAGLFLAGWKPASSPYLKGYDPLGIPRIRSQGKIKEDGCKQFCSEAWLDWLAHNPDKRYTSDGDPRVISYPAAKAGYLAGRYRTLGRAY
jgi:peptidoglycan/xylan/chitin deacetylase (PgdA/CDA1 family)